MRKSWPQLGLIALLVFYTGAIPTLLHFGAAHGHGVAEAVAAAHDGGADRHAPGHDGHEDEHDDHGRHCGAWEMLAGQAAQPAPAPVAIAILQPPLERVAPPDDSAVALTSHGPACPRGPPAA